MYVSGSFLSVLGVPMAIGRSFTDADDRPGGGPDGAVAILSYRYWQEQYGGTPDVLGSTLRVAGAHLTIVGVTAREFLGPDIGMAFNIAVPLSAEPLIRGAGASRLNARNNYWLQVIHRLGPDRTPEQARAALDALRPGLRDATMPAMKASLQAEYLRDRFDLAPVGTGVSYLRNEYKAALWTLMAIFGLVLFIACTNLANLQLARASARQREFAVRLALGASRGRIARLLLTESLLLAIAGAAGGLAFAHVASSAILLMLSTSQLHLTLDLTLDWRLLAFTSTLTGVTGLLFGLAPAFRSAGVDVQGVLKHHARGVTGGWRRFPLEKLLVAAQVGLALIVVFGATLFVRSFIALSTADPRFDPRHVLVLNADVSKSGVPKDHYVPLQQRIVDTLHDVPGVEAATMMAVTPVVGGSWFTTVKVDGYTPRSTSSSTTLLNSIGADYFTVLGTPLLAGRTFGPADRAGAPDAAIVNEAFVQRYFAGQHPVGRTLELEERDGWKRLIVVGVVRDARYQSMRSRVPPTTYLAAAQAQDPRSSTSFAVRGSGNLTGLSARVAGAVAGAHPGVTFEIFPYGQRVQETMTRERVLALLSAFLGLLALLVAGVGLYGMMLLAVTRRRNEIGVRLALGAEPATVTRLVLRDVALVTGLGIIGGGLAGLWSSAMVGKLLFGLTPRDPTTLILAVGLLACVALTAGYLPARRAARLDPTAALRDD